MLGHTHSLSDEPFPKYDETKLQQSTIEIVLQVNGKVRSKLHVARDTSEKDLEGLSLADESVRKHVGDKKIMKTIVVKNKLVNLVVR
jgi:leucyl-tRNA synthetase